MKAKKSLIGSISGAFAILSGYAFIGLSLLIVTEVVARKLFGRSLQSVDEISGYVVAVISSFAFAYALIMNAHTRIDIFYGKFSNRARQLLDVLAYMVIAGVAGFMTWTAWTVLSVSWKFGTVSIGILSIPLWIPQSLWFIGSVLFFVITMVFFVRAFRVMTGAIPAEDNLNPTQNETL